MLMLKKLRGMTNLLEKEEMHPKTATHIPYPRETGLKPSPGTARQLPTPGPSFSPGKHHRRTQKETAPGST